MITDKFRDLWVKHGQQRQRLQMYYKHPSIGFDEDAESEHLDELYNAMIAELDFIDRSYVELDKRYDGLRDYSIAQDHKHYLEEQEALDRYRDQDL
jgi:hypothetical protein